MVLYVLMYQQVDRDRSLYSAMKNAASMGDGLNESRRVLLRRREPTNLDTLLLAMRGRHSANPIDKVCAIAFPFQKRAARNFHKVTFPIYDPNTPISVAWERLICSIASTKMEFDDMEWGSHIKNSDFHRTTTIQLLCLFPHPSIHHWFPSWTQVQQYPDVSVRDNDQVPVTGEMDYSLRIMSGRIYRGCSLKLQKPPTPKGNTTYHCSMYGELLELVATVPGIELNIDSGSKYVLVDISPDHSLWSSREYTHWCQNVVGHAHPPIWQESVVIVCKEVDSLEHAQPVQVTTGSPAILRYRLRRITTLRWEFCPQGWSNNLLLVKSSLEHMRSVVCSAEASVEGPHSVTPLCLLDVFCDPAAVAGLPIKNGRREWDKCPLYEVYLV